MPNTLDHGLKAYRIGNDTVDVLALPANAGLDFTGCVPGKPTKDITTNKWTQVNLESKWMVDTGKTDDKGHRIMAPASMRVAIVTSTGAATPATITGFVKVTTNGRYVFDVQRDKLSPELTAVRKVIADANKADYLQNGPPAKQDRQATTVELPGLATASAPASQATTSETVTASAPATVHAPGLDAEQLRALKAAGFTAGEIMAENQRVIDQAMTDGGNPPHVTTTTNTPKTVASVPAGKPPLKKK